VRLDIVSVNVGTPSVLLEWSGGDVISAIDKAPVTSPEIMLTELTCIGDVWPWGPARPWRRLLTTRDRDLSGGVPESDG
jgi:hypothetical protein